MPYLVLCQHRLQVRQILLNAAGQFSQHALQAALDVATAARLLARQQRLPPAFRILQHLEQALRRLADLHGLLDVLDLRFHRAELPGAPIRAGRLRLPLRPGHQVVADPLDDDLDVLGRVELLAQGGEHEPLQLLDLYSPRVRAALGTVALVDAAAVAMIILDIRSAALGALDETGEQVVADVPPAVDGLGHLVQRQSPLHLLPQVVRDDPQLRGRHFDPFLGRAGPVDVRSLIGMEQIAAAVPQWPANVDRIPQDAPVERAAAAERGGSPRLYPLQTIRPPRPGRRDAVSGQPLSNLAHRDTVGVEAKDPPHHLGFRFIDHPAVPGDLPPVVNNGLAAVAVG